MCSGFLQLKLNQDLGHAGFGSRNKSCYFALRFSGFIIPRDRLSKQLGGLSAWRLGMVSSLYKPPNVNLGKPQGFSYFVLVHPAVSQEDDLLFC